MRADDIIASKNIFHLPPVQGLRPVVLRADPSGQTGLAPPQLGVLKIFSMLGCWKMLEYLVLKIFSMLCVEKCWILWCLNISCWKYFQCRVLKNAWIFGAENIFNVACWKMLNIVMLEIFGSRKYIQTKVKQPNKINHPTKTKQNKTHQTKPTKPKQPNQRCPTKPIKPSLPS